MKLTRELWARIEPLLSQALEMDTHDREAWLGRIAVEHPDLEPMLRRMLATHDRAERAAEMETVPKLSPPSPASLHAEGERIGPFVLRRQLGRGGMGEVWLAAQADGRVEREVALKLPAPHLSGGVWEERFRRERDILARLTHPNIARLYDAGVDERGQPWLAMEYVQGRAIGDAAEALSLRDRLALFRQVLAAVGHAHQHLVVHRDLKPANILVDASGHVKLLDFGIAKLLDEGEEPEAASDLTRTGGRVMTLRYGSPEQAAGEAITTASDIYSLGVVLHELLAGVSPYAPVREGRMMRDDTLRQADITLPSSVAQPRTQAGELSGDLDAILLKALRRDPAQRYASAQQFDEDIARYLEHRPVAARAGTWRYLAARFARRHRLPIAAAAAVLATLVVGLFFVDQQRRVAVAERERAQKHFDSVRRLANTFMFDVHGAIQNLPGSLKARELLVSTSLTYLDQLSTEARDDPALAVEISQAYRKLADLQGDPHGSNLGNVRGAFDNLDRARKMLDALSAARPGNLAVERERREVSLAFGRMLRGTGGEPVLAEGRNAIALAEAVAAMAGAGREDRRRLAVAYIDYGYALGIMATRPEEGLAQIRKAQAVLEPLVREDPSDRFAREALAGSYERESIVGETRGEKKHLEEAAALQQRANDTNEAIARDFPGQGDAERDVARGYTNLASTLRMIGRTAEARRALTRAVEISKRMSALQPEDAGWQVMALRVFSTIAGLENNEDRYPAAIEAAKEGLTYVARIPPAVRETVTVQANIFSVQSQMGLAQASLGLDEKAKLTSAQRLVLLRDGRENMLKDRAFRVTLVERGIDVTSATTKIKAIDDNVAEVDAAIRKYSKS